MKILYHHRIASKDGQYVHLEELSNALIEQGHELLFVGPKIVESDAFGSEGGIVPLLKQYIPKSLYELLEFSYSFYDFIKLFYAIKTFKPDVIYERCNLFFVSGIWAKKITKLPLLLEVNSPLYEERAKFNGISLHKLAKWSENYVWKNADYTLPVTQVLANILEQNTGINNQVVIHNGINKKRFDNTQYNQNEQLKQTLGIDKQFVLGFTGFVREWHKIEQVLDIIKEHEEKNLLLLIVGDGPASETLKNYAQQLNIADSLVITGIVEREVVNQYVSLFDIALQPAVTPYASPLKMFEYLAMGKLIVAPDSDNIKEILEDKVSAVLFKKDDENSFKQAIIRAIELDNRELLCKNAMKTIEQRKYTWTENAIIVSNLFKSLVVK